jgi:DNA mismatch repair protein MSH2
MTDNMNYEDENEKNIIQLCVNVTYGKNGREINAAIYNADERKFIVTEFQDNEHFSNFENLLLQTNPQNNNTDYKLLIQFPPLSTEKEKVNDIISLCDIQFEEKFKEDFPVKNLETDLNMLLDKNINQYVKETQLTKALSSLMCLVNSHKLLQEKTNHGKFKLESYTLSNFMKLDLAAINALSIFPKASGISNYNQDENSTLLGLLDKCKTQIGSRCLRRWLKQPLQNLKEIEKRMDVVEGMIKDKALFNHVRNDFLKKIPDLDKLYAKFYKVHSKKKYSASLIECIKVYQLVAALKSFCNFLNEHTSKQDEHLYKYYLDDLQGNLEDFEKFEEMIEQSIDMNKAKRGEYIINPSFSPKLGELNKNIEEVRSRIDELREQVSDDLGIDVKLTDNNTYTFVFEVNKKEGDEAFRKSKNKYKTISIKQKAISFTVNDLQDLVSDYNDHTQSYMEQQKEVVSKILEIVSTYYPAMEKASSLISEIDVLSAFAHVSSNSPNTYVRPRFNEGGNLNLKESRHPCLALIDNTRCVANDCEMKRNVSSLHIITGPNMGGKSTYIRQVAICIYLAHVGCFVPCSSAEIPLMDAIITRVGASDMQLKGISTFMSEMLETSCMFKAASERSLLIVDELGRGTSTSEGFGISWAVAEHIVKNIKSFCLFATHFHELTTMEGQIAGVKNFYVSAISKDNQILMQYKVKPGAVERSYGISVAEMLKFPDEIIRDAKQKAKELERFEELKPKKDGEIEQEDDEEADQMEEEKNGEAQKPDGMELEDDLISFAKRATLQMKHKVIQLVQQSVEDAKNLKNTQEKKDLLQKLVQDIKRIELEN